MRPLAAGFVLALSAAAGPAAAQSVIGKYTVEGTNPDGSRYGGEVEISQTSETTCSIRWNTGGVASSGICMCNGNAFAASYVLNDDIGLIVYQIMDSGEMDGLWTIAGRDGHGAEKLTPVR